MTSASPSPQEQLEKLQAELSSRRSIVHFAHTGVASVWALLFGGAAAKLFLESVRTPLLAWAASAVVAGLAYHALKHFLRGRKAMREEDARFEHLKELRRQLKLDDPSALLPG